jgi:glycosyltransferase involved in cell wall biosynthesis
MKIAIDTSPLRSSHRFRGVGIYTKHLIEALKKVDKKNKYFFLYQQSAINYQQFDIIHYPYFDLFWLTLPLKKPKPTVVTVHDLIPLVFPDKFPKGLKGWVKYQRQKYSLRGAKAIITDSMNSKKDIIRFIGFPEEKIHVVYLAPGEEFKQLAIGDWQMAVSKKYSLPNRFVLYVGHANYNKNVLGLIKACKKAKIPVVIVGQPAAQKEFKSSHIENQPLVQLIEVYGKDPDVVRLGFLPKKDLVAVYNLAAVYCQPSFYEGFGLPVLEAMACGTPVVAANVSSLPEVCGNAAVMVDPEKVDKIAEGIKKATDDKMLRKRLIKRGLIQAKKFSWEKTAKETIKVYQKVYEQKNKGNS